MKARLDVLGRIKEARRRLRDLAAGGAAVADAAHERATEEHDDAARVRDEILDDASGRIFNASGIADLLLIEHERAAAEALVHDRARDVVAAQKVRDEHRLILRDKARALRVSEKVVARVRAGLHTAERKREQNDSDELVSGRAARNS